MAGGAGDFLLYSWAALIQLLWGRRSKEHTLFSHANSNPHSAVILKFSSLLSIRIRLYLVVGKKRFGRSAAAAAEERGGTKWAGWFSWAVWMLFTACSFGDMTLLPTAYRHGIRGSHLTVSKLKMRKATLHTRLLFSIPAMTKNEYKPLQKH